MTTPKEHLQSALDAITYNASINQVFATTEFQSIKADLDAVMEYLNKQDESCAAVYQQYRDIGENTVTNALLGNEPKDATTLLLDELNAMSVNEFDDGAAFEEFPAAEVTDYPADWMPMPDTNPPVEYPTTADLHGVIGQEINIRYTRDHKVWWGQYPANETSIEKAIELMRPILDAWETIGIELTWQDGLIVDIAKLPF